MILCVLKRWDGKLLLASWRVKLTKMMWQPGWETTTKMWPFFVFWGSVQKWNLLTCDVHILRWKGWAKETGQTWDSRRANWATHELESVRLRAQKVFHFRKGRHDERTARLQGPLVQREPVGCLWTRVAAVAQSGANGKAESGQALRKSPIRPRARGHGTNPG